jgi:hypothetical protein
MDQPISSTIGVISRHCVHCNRNSEEAEKENKRSEGDLDYTHRRNRIICAHDLPPMLPKAELIAFHVRYRVGTDVSSHLSPPTCVRRRFSKTATDQRTHQFKPKLRLAIRSSRRQIAMYIYLVDPQFDVFILLIPMVDRSGAHQIGQTKNVCHGHESSPS